MADPFPIELRARGGDGKRQRVHVIRCASCGAEDLVAAHMRALSEAHLRGTFQQRGWRVSPAGSHACPACAGLESARRRATQKEKPAMPAAIPSPAASSAIADAYLLLQDGYDHAAKNYKPGWSDERIAKESGLSLPEVKRRREHDFGPLVADTTLEDLRTDWAALRADIGKMLLLADGFRALAVDIERRHDRLQVLLNAAAAKGGLAPLIAPKPSAAVAPSPTPAAPAAARAA